MTSRGEPRRFGKLVAGGQIVGGRQRQEDDFEVLSLTDDGDQCAHLMILADGMGGHPGGVEASGVAVSAFADAFRERKWGGTAGRLRDSLDAAEAAVARHAEDHEGFSGMGCTLVACVVKKDGTAQWTSVGDSLLFHLPAGSDRTVTRLNEDHSMRPVLEDMVRLGRMTPEEAQRGPVNQLRSALTGEGLTLVDEGAKALELKTDDWLIVASDGLNTLQADEVRRLCDEHRTPFAVVSELLMAVTERARTAQDNTTVIAYRHSPASSRSWLARLFSRRRRS